MAVVTLSPIRRKAFFCSVAFVLAAPVAAATSFTVNYANIDTSRWSCRLCEFDRAMRHAGTVAAGALESSRGEMRFGRDNGIDGAGSYLSLNGDYRTGTTSGLILELGGRHLGLDSRDAATRVRMPNRFGMRIRYREIPRNIGRDARTPFTGTDPLSLPNDWVAGYSTASMTQLASASRSFELATERGRSDIDAWISLAPRLTLKTELFVESKDGVAQTFRDAFYQAAALPKPIRYRTERSRAGLYYEHPGATVALSYGNRRFDNHHDALVWHSPYASVTSTGRSATAPSNTADTLSFVSRVRLGDRTSANATLVRDRARQSAPFPPYTTNRSLGLPPTAARSLNGERVSESYSVNVVSRPTRDLRLTIARAVIDHDDQRPEIALTPVLGDLFATRETPAVGYSFKRKKTDIVVRYTLPPRSHMTAGFRSLDRYRTNLEIAANEENRAWLEATGDIGAGWHVRIRHARADRDASKFRGITSNNPLTRRFYQAERLEREWRGGIRFEPKGAGFSTGVDLDYQEHDYPRSPLGLQREVAQGWFLDVAYSAGGAASLSGFYGKHARRSKTTGSVSFSRRDWSYHVSDTVTTAGARLRDDGFLHPAVNLTVDYAYSNGIGDYSTAIDNMSSRFPSLVSRHESVDARLRYGWRTRVDLVLRYYFERFRAADWATDGIGQDGIRNVLSLGRSSPRYRNHLFALSVERTL